MCSCGISSGLNSQPPLQKEKAHKEQTDEVQPTPKPTEKHGTEKLDVEISIPEPSQKHSL